MTSMRERLWSSSAIAGGMRAAWGTAALLLVVGCSTFGAPPMEPLTETTLAAASERWSAHGSESYRIVVEVRAPRIDPVVYALEVAGGKPIRIERDGVIVAAENADDDDFSVSGLFALLQQDLRWTAVEHVGDVPAVDLRALFEPETGRLVRYRRTVGTTKRRVLFIEVLAYEPLATPCLPSSA
jgi:hypothetical protein